ncbi:MAG TPA: DUF3108 domain-containing protein [Chitinophagales bacterium]|nr:DUF3108 domain-containing protein [Chitinophagales bacterium]
MKKYLCLLLSLSAYSLKAQVDSQCILPNTAFSDGEKITYKVIYNWNSLWLNAGEASFAVSDGVFGSSRVYHVVGEGISYKSYDWFFKVKDTYESYIDKQTMQPLKFVRNVNEGGYTIYNNVTFKHDENKAISTHGEFKVPSCIQDVLSSIYYTRNLDFSSYKVNDTIPVNLFLDDSVYHVYIRYLGKESVKIKSGSYNCIKFRPLLINGTIFKGGEKMTVWVTDDENKIPVLVESPILIGFIRAELHKYEGLRNPMKSKTG